MRSRVGLLEMDFSVPGTHNLKEKRSRLNSIKDRLRHRFNVSVSEVGMNDVHQRTLIACAAVSNDGAHLNGLLDTVLSAARSFRDLALIDYRIEVF